MLSGATFRFANKILAFYMPGERRKLGMAYVTWRTGLGRGAGFLDMSLNWKIHYWLHSLEGVIKNGLVAVGKALKDLTTTALIA